MCVRFACVCLCERDPVYECVCVHTYVPANVVCVHAARECVCVRRHSCTRVSLGNPRGGAQVWRRRLPVRVLPGLGEGAGQSGLAGPDCTNGETEAW